MNKTIRQQYRKNSKKSLCKSKTAKKCKKLRAANTFRVKNVVFVVKSKIKDIIKLRKFKEDIEIWEMM